MADVFAQPCDEWTRSGDQRAADAADRRSAALRETLGGGVSPALRRIRSVTLLACREREIASLAARGGSNAEIGGRLHISVRTAENHLHRIDAKLRVSRRSQLAAML